MHTFFLLLWGTCTLASIIGAIIVVILHNRHLRLDGRYATKASTLRACPAVKHS